MAEGADTPSETIITAEIVEVVVEEPGRAAKKATGRQMPKWEADARDRVRAAVRRFARPLADLVARDANEGDTRLLVTDFLCDGLGYDKYEDLTTEYQVKGEFADYGVRIAKQLVAFIEVKRAATKLGAKHLRQVEMYAVNEGVEWMILTNGQVWQGWHLTAGLPVGARPRAGGRPARRRWTHPEGRHLVPFVQNRIQASRHRRPVAGHGRHLRQVHRDRHHQRHRG
jgi:Type I restriction enzyme R protein N terminus (HSDR_N)